MALSILMSLSLTRRNHYGRLSGRNIEDMLANTRDLDGPDKRKPQDFALWKAEPQHICVPSHGAKDPGWHLECTMIQNTWKSF
jgi:cysteinyl-tRNA synthetase